MKKIFAFLFAVCFVFSAYGEGVVLSDTSIAGYDNTVSEEPFIAPNSQTTYNSSDLRDVELNAKDLLS